MRIVDRHEVGVDGDQDGDRQQQEKEITPIRSALDKTSGWPSEAAKETEDSEELWNVEL